MQISKRIFLNACASSLLVISLVTASSSQPLEDACRRQADSLAEALKRTNEQRSAALALDQDGARKSLGELSAQIQQLPQLQDFLRCLTKLEGT